MTQRGVLIGCGHVASYHLNAWKQVPDVAILAVADLDRARAEQRAAEYGIPGVYTDYRSMIEHVQPDFVDIATPPHTHHDIVLFAVAAGVSILCQKPVAPDLNQLRAMVEVAEKAGVLFMVNENGRFQPHIRDIAQRVSLGELGRPFYANFTARKRLSVPQPSFQQGFFVDMPRLMIYELGVHFLDTLRYLFGEPYQLYARTHRISPHIQGEDTAIIHLDLRGMSVVVDMSWAAFPTEVVARPTAWANLRIEGPAGTAYLQRDGTLHWLTDAGTETRQYSADSIQQGYVGAQQHFVACLRTGDEPETSGRETLKTMELVFGAYYSAAQGTVYRVGQDLDKLARVGTTNPIAESD